MARGGPHRHGLPQRSETVDHTDQRARDRTRRQDPRPVRHDRHLRRRLRHQPGAGGEGHGHRLPPGGPHAVRHQRAPHRDHPADHRHDPGETHRGRRQHERAGDDDGGHETACPQAARQPVPRHQRRRQPRADCRRLRRGRAARFRRAGNHRRCGPLRPVQRAGAAGRRPDGPSRHPHPVRGRGGHGAAARHARADRLRRNRVRLRHRGGVHGR